ncbi:3-hydroxyacyl-CoA dehydrogenase NAD-binding domain-containing protein [Acuticoccus sediminis]|uniref:3-hydroxyacyl-CoA dehydrogenase NAD-binding domain-containing protein n=1 Tax=Acuticoccus sediminis TaxID=2184697 RepID=UPI001CFED457|nr:3-hydroxyacyl-CoA dehydrogenase NAD-binding domain-containing protein [Acuticoccus sediminis]
MSETAVIIEREGPVGLIGFNNPPVNAASHALRLGLKNGIETFAADDTIKVIALYGIGRSFVAGADIREFGKPRKEPLLNGLINEIEAQEKPVIAVCHGNALGGGLELALGCHARIALPGLTVGFPEVDLGLIPGAGGTQRAPRLVGLSAALDLVPTGKRIKADEAVALGLFDRISEGDPRAVAVAAGNDVVNGTLCTRRTSDLKVEIDEDLIEAARVRTLRKGKLLAPQKAIDAVAAAGKPIAEGLAEEVRLFQECLDSPQRGALVHAFFAERAVSKIPEKDAAPREIASLAVIGGGTMGSGITTAALIAGLPVRLMEVSDEAVERGRGTVLKNLGGALKRGKLTQEKHDAAVARLSTTTDIAELKDADLVIEAVFEDMDVKKDIFRRLDAAMKDGAILASNTSYLDINAIAAETGRPADVLGLHFFSPAHIMRLLEIVVADRTAPEVVATGFALAKRLGKVGVRAGVCDGFIGNRILSHYRKVADYLVMDGATPQQIDRALEDFGFAMGPFAVADLAGLDIGMMTRKRLAPTRSNRERYIPIADRICERGWYGRKTGQGYYLYGDREGPNPAVAEIIEQERTNAGITAREITDEEIVTRYMTAMIAEGTRVLEDGIALRPVDIDAVFLFGYGFPRFRGGPMFYADTIGAKELVRRIETFAGEDDFFWRVPPLLARMAQEGTTFADLNERA